MISSGVKTHLGIKMLRGGKVNFKVPPQNPPKNGGHLSNFLLFKAPFGHKKTFKFEKIENGAYPFIFVPLDWL